MSCIKSILVGIDPSKIDAADASKYSEPISEAIKNGLWLAEKAGAKITFFAAVDLPEEQVQAMKTDPAHPPCTLLATGRATLDRLVATAKQRGLAADSKLVSGPAWLEMIREVDHNRHDIVVVGTRNVSAFQRFLFGGTAQRLLHECPCPVWVTRPEARPLPHNILITSDFSDVSEVVIKLGLAIGEFSGAKVNLVHAVNYELDRLWSVGLLHTNTEQYHARVNEEARLKLANQLAECAGDRPTANVELHIIESESVADEAIVKFIAEQQIDLLLMGTIARSGFEGISVGNTAERLVTHVPCSMVAVKPRDFKPSVNLADSAIP